MTHLLQSYLAPLRYFSVDLNFQQDAANVMPGVNGVTATDAKLGFSVLMSQVLAIAVTIGVILVLLYTVWGGLDWITAGGDKGKTEKARDKITQGIVGLVLLVSSVAIVTFVQTLLGICILSFSGSCK